MEIINFFEIFWFVAFAIAFWHATKKNSLADALIFLVPAVAWGFFAEYFGVHLWGIYEYPQNYMFMIGGIPLTIALGWATIKHFGYYITTEVLHVRKKLNLDLESAFLSTLIDFIILEPFALIFKFWTWKQNDFWFGAPLFNFIGWFSIITIYLMTYQIISNKFKDKKQQAIYFTLALIPAFIILQLGIVIYLSLFGWF